MLAQLAGILGRRFEPRIFIFTFHRIVESNSQCSKVYPTTDVLSTQLKQIQKSMPIGDLHHSLGQLYNNTLKENTAAITFDDGYLDNHSLALPVLKSCGATATFFISTGYLGSNGLFGEQIRIGLQNTALRRLDLSEIGLGIQDFESFSQRLQLSIKVREILKYMPPSLRDEKTKTICRQFAVDVSAPMLCATQVLDLQNNGMSVASHSHMHPIPNSISTDEFRGDVAKSIQVLRQIGIKDSPLFAYPNGKMSKDYVERHSSILRELGFQFVLTTNWGVTNRQSDAMQIPRFSVPETASIRFKANLLRHVLKIDKDE